MIYLNQALCTGCGVCIEECPTGAITLVNGTAKVDSALCDGCESFDETRDRRCITVCPVEALVWVTEPVPETEPGLPSLAVIESPIKVVKVETKEPVPWRRAVLPAVGSALSWVGRQVVLRLAPLTLDALEATLERRFGQRSEDAGITPVFPEAEGSQGKQRRHRHRRGRSQE